jgi:hypothetical protein
MVATLPSYSTGHAIAASIQERSPSSVDRDDADAVGVDLEAIDPLEI